VTEMSVMDLNESGFWVASLLERSAEFRAEKATDYPDDARNRRSEAALREAAIYVRAQLGRSRGIQRIAELVSAGRASDIELIPVDPRIAGFPGPGSERLLSRYGFDRRDEPLDVLSHEEVLHELHKAMLQDLNSEHGWEIDPDSSLGQRLRSTLGNREALDSGIETVRLLTDIRNVLGEIRDHLILPDAPPAGV
jgi:hypothetical protein